MPKQLTVHNATITTASVEVKTLTISGKQVTLAVFKQLREEPMIGEDGAFLGEPWGYVNYHPDKCGDDRTKHLHVVWQRDGDLLRSRVDAPWDAAHYHPAMGLYAEALIAEGYSRGGEAPDSLAIFTSLKARESGTAFLTHKGVKFRGTVRERFCFAFDQGRMATPAEILTSEHGPGWSSAAFLDQLPAAQHQKSWRLLNELPQLFIAV